MPTLFISYKRGTSAVAPLMERLRDAHYRLWFDRDEIHLGDPDWQARIDQGIERCDGLILNLTPAACASEQVQYEVRKALELGKPIFPIVLEKLDNWSDALTQVGLSPSQHTEDFTDVEKWDEQIQRLLRDLEIQGLPVTRHDRRQERDRNNPNYVLHQTYLKRLAERIGILNLAQINPDNAQGIELERVYIDSPTGFGIGVKLQGDGEKYQGFSWWISNYGASKYHRRFPSYENSFQPNELGFEKASLEYLMGNIESEYKELFERQYLQSKDKYEGREDIFRLHLQHIASSCDRLVILGAPGSGKSTFVKYLALCLAGSGIDDWPRRANIASLDNWPHGALTPIYIELRRFVASTHFPADINTPATADHLWAYIQHEILDDGLSAYADDLRYDLEHGHAVLILDGLDEVSYPEGKLKQRQAQLISLAQSLNTRYATSRIIVASRPYAYEGWSLPSFQAVIITAFEVRHRIDLAERLYLTAGLVKEAANKKAKALNTKLRRIDPELKDRPLFVTLMATIYLKGDSEGLPTRRGALYRESILLLLDRWTASKLGALSLVELLGEKSLDDLYDRLAALAYDVHENYGEQPGTPEIDEGLLYKHLKPLGRTTAAELIPYLSENAGVLVSPGQDDEKDVFHFAHRTFQEYLAAAYMIQVCLEADSLEIIRDHIVEKPQVWRIPCTLAGDVLADTDRRGDLWDLLDDLLDDDVSADIPADDPRWWTVWLASVVLQEQEMLSEGKLRRSERAVCDQLRDWILFLLETPQALDPPERASCGRALSLLGDPRRGVGAMEVNIEGTTLEIPQIEWCTIPAPKDGKFIMGAEDQRRNRRREVELTYSYKMSKYLVTYQQYRTFEESEDYDKVDWWEGFPSDSQPQQLRPQFNKYTNHPRDTISWYQAVAFARWLTAKYREAGIIDETVEIRLPTEIEWEYAARGMDERKYPYPGDFDAMKGNTRETGIGQTSAVGTFPDGASPLGVLDMSGNQLEWCMNDYKNPEFVEGYGNGERKVLRGGSFYDYQGYAAASFRNDSILNLDLTHVSVRLVLAAPIASLASGTLISGSE